MEDIEQKVEAEVPAQADTAAHTDTALTVEQLKAEHAKELRQVRLDGEVRYVLAKLGARNPALAAKALDLSGVGEDGENGVTGVEEAARRLMASDPYLFGVSMGPVGGDSSSGGVHGGARRDPDGMSDREYYAMVMGNT
ncbi:MAG: hypothetical protein IJX14_04090 [Clostridia bacterium]|nr:hypothetical protein [Clostridia bacterium]